MTAWIDDINELGKVTVFLNQPLNKYAIHKVTFDNETFELTLEKDSNVPLEKLDFVWECTSFELKDEDGRAKLEFQLNFTDAISVSNAQKADVLKIRFLQGEFFMGTVGGMILDENKTISYSMSRQMPNTELSRAVDKAST